MKQNTLTLNFRHINQIFNNISVNEPKIPQTNGIDIFKQIHGFGERDISTKYIVCIYFRLIVVVATFSLVVRAIMSLN